MNHIQTADLAQFHLVAADSLYCFSDCFLNAQRFFFRLHLCYCHSGLIYKLNFTTCHYKLIDLIWVAAFLLSSTLVFNITVTQHTHLQLGDVAKGLQHRTSLCGFSLVSVCLLTACCLMKVVTHSGAHTGGHRHIIISAPSCDALSPMCTKTQLHDPFSLCVQ